MRKQRDQLISNASRPEEPPVEFERRSAQRRLLYSRADLAAMFGVTTKTIYRLEKSGVLKPVKLGQFKSLTLYRAADIAKLIGAEEVA